VAARRHSGKANPHAGVSLQDPNGKIPLLEIEEGVYLPESDAILNYLAEGTPFLPSERLLRAQVLQWLFFEQYSHEPYIAVARYIIRYLGRPEKFESKLQEKMAPGYAALQVMEKHLANRRFFVAERYTIADIGLYAYTHVAHEGGFELSPTLPYKHGSSASGVGPATSP